VRLIRLLALLGTGHRVMFVGKVEENAPGPLVAGFTRQPAAALGIFFCGSGGHRRV
jgi:hypothetical protein